MPFSFQRPKFSKLTQWLRSVYNFDGVDDRAQLTYRAIDPDGDNTFEFWSPANLAINLSIISQNLAGTFITREFDLGHSASSGLQLVFGGSSTIIATIAQGYKPATKYGLTLIGATFQLFEGGIGGQLIRSGTFARGTAREASAQTVISARTSGVGFFTGFSNGLQYDIRINGTLWPIADSNQSIQLPYPTGLGIELITQIVLENPAVKGNQWTYLGGGRWEYTGDGSFNELRFIAGASHPASGFLDFEIESITGTLSCVSGSTAIPRASFTTTGKKRYLYTDLNEGSALGSAIAFKRSSAGVVTSCIIKNISFKPLGTCNPTTLVNTTSDRWQEV